jgi:hypothetical protein
MSCLPLKAGPDAIGGAFVPAVAEGPQRRHSRAHAIAVLAGLLIAASGLSAAEVFRWVGAQGVTHYGSTPPAGVKATLVTVPPTPAAPARSTEAGAASGAATGSAKTAGGPPRVQAAPASAPDSPAARLQRCAHARQQLATVIVGGPVFRYDAAGQRVYLADALRDSEIARWRQAVDRECAGLDSEAATRERAQQMFYFDLCQRAKEKLQLLEQASTRSGAQELQEARESVRDLCSSARFPADTGTRGEWFHQEVVARQPR